MLRPVTNEDTASSAENTAATLAAAASNQVGTPLSTVAAKPATLAMINPAAKRYTRRYSIAQPTAIQPIVKRLVKPVIALPRTAKSNYIRDIHQSDNPAFSYPDFARQLATGPGSIGAIAPSSKALARQVIKQADPITAKTVVELGPGTGVFTEQIIRNLSPEALFFAIELNQAFVQATRDRCPSANVYHDAASSLGLWLEKNNRRHADCIISSLPWTLFNNTEQDEILRVIKKSLAPGGVFVSIVYLGAKFRSRGRYFINNLDRHFPSVSCAPTVWRNLPPSQIYRCSH